MPCTEHQLLPSGSRATEQKAGGGAPRRGFKTEGKRWRKVQSSSSASKLSLYKSLRCTERRDLQGRAAADKNRHRALGNLLPSLGKPHLGLESFTGFNYKGGKSVGRGSPRQLSAPEGTTTKDSLSPFPPPQAHAVQLLQGLF